MVYEVDANAGINTSGESALKLLRSYFGELF